MRIGLYILIGRTGIIEDMQAKSRSRRRPKDEKRIPLSMRITPSVRKSLVAAAATSGRSITQEAELRLEYSLRDERVLDEALELAYGPINADFLLSLLAPILKSAQQVSNMFSDYESWMDNENTSIAVSEIFHELFSSINCLYPLGKDDEYGRRRDRYYVDKQILGIMNNEEWLRQRRSKIGTRTFLLEKWLTDLKKKAEAEEAKPLDVDAMTKHISIMKDDGTIVGGDQ